MITVYSTHCPKCQTIETKLKMKHIEYTINDNVDDMLKKGFKSAPMLDIDGEILDFGQAIKWINQQEE